jgi:hypothetical protein
VAPTGADAQVAPDAVTSAPTAPHPHGSHRLVTYGTHVRPGCFHRLPEEPMARPRFRSLDPRSGRTYPLGMPLVQGPHPCDECGTILVTGPGPIDRDEALEDDEAGEHYRFADRCPNLECPSNHVLSRMGLRKVGGTSMCARCAESNSVVHRSTTWLTT